MILPPDAEGKAMHLPAFNDVQCPKCKRRFGWHGTSQQCPPCPRCGHKIPLADLEADEKEIEAFRQMLLERNDDSPTGKKPVS